ncbi:MAG: AbrB/MazE/SpoVT family DNA-binding domain-containing protein [Cyanobium sp. M30B3]|nr:MAG: AbrB/MazE/SpoVT family DNA-binding domain-containing protein [Cyanobium sp. M30B3]
MPDTELATITAKGQVTIPKAIREALNLRQGDQLRWDLDDGGVRVRLVSPLDLTDRAVQRRRPSVELSHPDF